MTQAKTIQSVPILVPVVNVNDSHVTINQQCVGVGTRIEKGSQIAVLESSKAVFDLESPASGYLLWQCEQGRRIECGQIIGWIYNSLADLRQAEAKLSLGPITQQRTRPVTKKAVEYATKHGIDLSQIAGDGLLTETNLRMLVRESDTDIGRDEVFFDDSQQRLAHNLRAAASMTIPSFVSRRFDGTPTIVFAREYGASIRVMVTESDIVLKACAMCLVEFDRFNYWLREKTPVRHASIRLGLALDVDGRLAVPVIDEPNQLSIREITNWRVTVQHKISREGVFFEGASFTFSNLAPLGIETFVPNLPPQHAAILGFGIGYSTHEDTSNYRVACLTFDHSIINGAYAARFLASLVGKLADPESLK